MQGGGVGALVGQVAPLTVARSAPWSGAARGSAVAHADLTELLIDLETLLTQLFHFLLNKNRGGGRKWSWHLGLITLMWHLNTHIHIHTHR